MEKELDFLVRTEQIIRKVLHELEDDENEAEEQQPSAMIEADWARSKVK